MIFSAFPASGPEADLPPIPDEADMTPPAAPMAMPKQAIERTETRARTARLRLPFLGGRIQGQP